MSTEDALIQRHSILPGSDLHNQDLKDLYHAPQYRLGTFSEYSKHMELHDCRGKGRYLQLLIDTLAALLPNATAWSHPEGIEAKRLFFAAKINSLNFSKVLKAELSA